MSRGQPRDDELESAFLLEGEDDHPIHNVKDDDDDDAGSHRSSDAQRLLPTAHANTSTASVFSFESIPMIPLTQSQARAPELQKKLSFINGFGLVIGSMIGSGLFSSPGPVLAATSAPGTALVVWFVSGLLAWMGALCYAELGAMLPMNGGEAVYLRQAFGSLLSFMFECVSILVHKPGSIAIVCTVLGEYVSRIAYHTYFFKVPHDSDEAVELADSVIPAFLPKLLAIIGLLLMSVLNAVSIRAGIRVQDALSVLKLLMAVMIAVVGFVILAQGSIKSNSFQGEAFAGLDTISFGQCALAFYSGLWAYDGWNNLNYVSGEMKDPHRDLPRVIMYSMPIVLGSYLLANVAYLSVLRPEVLKHTNTVAMDFGKKVFGPVGGILFAVCIALSCFGTVNASIFTGARIIYVSAKQGHIPAFFGKLSVSRQTPMMAIILQTVLTTVFILVGSFRELVNFYSLCAWIFYFLAVLALLVLRYTEPELRRPYRVWLSTPVLFCIIALFLCTTPFIEAPFESLAAVGFVLLAIPIWLVQVRFRNRLDSLCTGLRQQHRGYQGMEMTES